MKPSKAVKKGRRARLQKAQKTKKKTPTAISLQAVAEEPKRRYVLLRDVGVLYRPIKKPVTLRLDADVIAWFKRSGCGYQTRINWALRKMMKDEVKEGKGTED